MPSVTIADVDYLIFYNGYAEDMRTYLSVNKAAWTCEELWFPYGVNILYGPKKKSRLQIVCENLDSEIFTSYTDNQYHRVDKLIELGANPDIEDTEGMTPLMICARDGWEEHQYMASWLIEYCGADVNRKNRDGYTALHLAAANNKHHIVKVLLSHGADINTNNCDDYARPIDWAANRGHLLTVKILLENGATINSVVMHSAIRKPGNAAIIKYLHAKGCPLPPNPLFVAISNNYYSSIKCLIKCGADPNERYEPHTILDLYLDTPEAVVALCEAGADVNLLSNGRSIVWRAVNTYKGNLTLLKTLCKYRVNLNVRDHDGQTPLHILVEDARPGDDITYIKEFLKNSIDFSIIDNFGSTALQIAQSRGLTEVVCLIKRAILRQKMK